MMMNTNSSSKYYFDEVAANRAVAFIERHVTHVKGELSGKPFILEEWQKEQIIKPLFGYKNRKTDVRRYNTAYIEIPRKNGKSNLCAAIALYLLFADGEKGAEVYSAAGDRAQAGIVFDLARQMCLNDKVISNNCKIFKNSVVHEKSGSFYKAISADASTKHGFNASGIIFDELHVQPNRDLWDTLTTSTGARKQPLTIAITTAGYDKNSICWEVHEYAVKVQKGIIKDEGFLTCIYAADEDDDFTKVSTWKKANPGFGTIVKKEYLAKEAEKAQKIVSYENTFRRLHLNQWTTNETKWLSDQQWMTCDINEIKEEDFVGRECYAGLDLASVRDVTALVLIFPSEDRVDVIPYFFAPRDNAFIRSRRDGIDYLGWEKKGLMELTDGDVTDYNFVKAKVKELAEKFVVKSIAYDRWNSSQLVIDLLAEGLPMAPFGQGFVSMSAPTKELERLVLAKQLNHGGNEVLRWMCSNLQMRLDPAGNIKMDKGKSKEKIDGMVSLAMALGRMMNPDDKSGPSVYEESNITFI